MILVVSCSLGMLGAAIAQQPEAQESPHKPSKETVTEKQHGAGPKHSPSPETKTSGERKGAGETKALGQSRTGGETNTPGPKQQRGPKAERNALKTEKSGEKTGAATANEQNAGGQPGPTSSPAPTGAEQGKKGRHGGGENVNAKTSSNPAVSASVSPAGSGTRAGNAAATGPENTVSQPNNRVANTERAAQKPDPQQVQQIKSQHANFRAQPRPDRAPAVTFNASYRIQGADRWQGSQYEAFRAYHPERHDRSWYHSHYGRIELIGGGYYYWNNGYWAPAWGYDPSAEYYPYDGPIYVGHRAEPPDRVIADVQAELQNMGYYQGEVDGLLGPLTREALTAYQADHGLTQTAAIDEPTLDALELSS